MRAALARGGDRAAVRFIQVFICWGGGSRRFIDGPQKFNPDALTWMANELQSAMPGALLGTDHLIAFLLYHFWLLYPAVILFSGAELIAVLREHRVKTDKLTVSITSPLSG